MTKSPDQLLAEGFAQHAARWATGRGAPAAAVDATRQAAMALSLATGEGHVCILLDGLARAQDDAATRFDTGDWRRLLIASGIVGTPEAPGAMPLILDADDRLYLHRYFDYERRLTIRLRQACALPPDAGANAAPMRERLAALFADNAASRAAHGDTASADWQQLAAALALRGRFTVISGGPGTGKTTTVVKLLACLLALDPTTRIALAAPTGKAAARMTEAIRKAARSLAPETQALLPKESSTVHRLLGVLSGGDGFRHHAGDPLPIDALVVDEASMLDLALATKLLEAVPPMARIVLIGDKDQLAAVESGAVFAELSADPSLSPACVRDLAEMTGTPAAAIQAPPPTTPSPLHDATVWFTRTYRFQRDSGIGQLAEFVNKGQATNALAWLREGKDPHVAWIAGQPTADTADANVTPDTLSALLQRTDHGFAGYLDAVTSDERVLAKIFEAFDRFRVLCAVREGARGVDALNAEMTRRWRGALRRAGVEDGAADSPWFPGRPVLVSTNDYVLKLFNGDIGLALPDASGQLLVYFADAAADGGFRAVAPVRLPRHETAFAMTIHKSQGSEFTDVLVVLPQQRSRVLNRELLYTGITRARERVAIAANADVLQAAITTTTRRHSGLLARLQEESAGARLD